MANEMALVRVDAHPTAAVRTRIRTADIPTAMFPLMDAVWGFIRGRSLTGHGHNVWVYRNFDHGQGEVEVEIGVQLASPFESDGNVTRSETPSGRAAHTFHYGEYEELPGVHAGLVAWCEERDIRLAGVSWEVYGDWSDDPAERRTDIYHLCVDSGGAS